MAAEWVDALGYAAGLLVSAANAPQLIKTLRTGSACDLSWGYLTLYLAGYITGIVYGVEARATPIVAANILAILGGSAISVAKALTGRGSPPPDEDALALARVRRLAHETHQAITRQALLQALGES